MYQAIFLDIDDTLLDFNACAAQAIRRALALRGEVYRDEMFPVFRRINVGFWHRIETGEITRAQLAADRFNAVFAALGLGHLDGPAFEVDFKRFLNEAAVPVPHAPDTVRRLADRYPLYAATNGPQHQQENRLRLAGLLPYFTAVFTSESMGADKPSAAFFAACFARLPGITPGDVLLVGDSLTADIAGGAACGMDTCWFNPNRRPCPPELTPTHIITDLRELEHLL
ncbi:MAG: YjjG family noncanonical pyrimidine nucleotidase [Clostridiales bacterium]|nr:YjjG family noncanonical pyrimidine nucleotidase [Candidatus Cacconaster stercorequi]